MASALFKAISAIGRQTTAFLQSLFLFPFNTVLQALHRFPGLSFRQTSQPPLLPCSTTSSGPAPGSGSGSASDFNSSSLSETLREARNDDDGGVGGDESRRIKSDMAVTSSLAAASGSQGQPTVNQKENLPAADHSPTRTLSQVTDKLSRLELDGSGTAAAQPTTSLRDVVNGTGSIAADGAVFQDADVDAAREVQRAPPVPLTHPVSQTSRPKETATTTTMQLGGETVAIRPKAETPEQAAERAMHSRFMREALDMARLALKTNETPVGCVLVYKGRVIARGMNATNVTRNGTRHAELMAICALLSFSPESDTEPAKSSEKGPPARTPLGDKTNAAQDTTEETSTWGDVDPKDGHLYPYGQKLHPSPRVDPSVITECTLYVTVEPCVMCASLLRQLGIKKVYFGAVNDKFGGTGGVFRIHKNSPHSMASAPPSPAPQNGKGIVRPPLERRPASTDPSAEEQQTTAAQDAGEENAAPVQDPIIGEHGVVISPIADTSALPGDGGNVERGYEAEGGWGRDEAVTLLRQFYVQENNRAPVPRKKEGRAARLAAMMERDGHGGGPVGDGAAVPKSEGDSGMNTPATQEPVNSAADNMPPAQEPAVEAASEAITT